MNTFQPIWNWGIDQPILVVSIIHFSRSRLNILDIRHSAHTASNLQDKIICLFAAILKNVGQKQTYLRRNWNCMSIIVAKNTVSKKHLMQKDCNYLCSNSYISCVFLSGWWIDHIDADSLENWIEFDLNGRKTVFGNTRNISLLWPMDWNDTDSNLLCWFVLTNFYSGSYAYMLLCKLHGGMKCARERKTATTKTIFKMCKEQMKRI